MAIDTETYALTEFRMAVKPETTLGTANTTTMQLLNLSEIPQPPLTDIDIREQMSGQGRTMKKADHYISDKGSERTFTISGPLDTTIGELFVENVIAIATATLPASVDIAYNYTPPSLVHGDTDADNCSALTFAWISGQADSAIILPGCVIESLTITADESAEGGRLHYTANVKSGYTPSYDQSDPTSMTAASSTFLYFGDMDTKRQFGGNDVLSDYLELNINNPTVFKGSQGTNNDPEQIIRGIPRIEASGVIGVKYDANIEPLYESYKSGTDVVLEFSNNDTWTAATTLGVKASYCRLKRDFSWGSAEAGAWLRIPFDCMAHTSGDLIQIII